MREAAERNLKEYKNFKSVSGRAEATLLREKSIDFIAAAQAFHWFDPVLTKKEFLRIARPGAKIILLWNRRDSEKDPFQRGYENFLQSRLPEYSAVTHKKIDENIIRNFFAPSALNTVTFNHFQTFAKSFKKSGFFFTDYFCDLLFT